MGTPARAHDVKGLEHELRESEPYVELVDKTLENFRLQTPDGKEYSLEDFRGKVVVLYFLYSRCKDECPLHSLKIAEVQKQVAEASLSEQFQFVAVATDVEPAEETANSMRGHGERFGLNPSNWIFLYGGPETRTAGIALSQEFALEFTPAGKDVQLHGVVTHLIDPDGRLRARYHGLDFDPLNLTVYAAALIHGGHDGSENPNAGGGTGFRMPGWAALTGGVLAVVFLLAAAALYARERFNCRRET
ncbi:MAG: SCO family protein [Gammaproteobacteria bacterium]|nr:SCO family protein [Gammaproteobacteria bacterium]